jgi:predicted phosphodiesterase
MAVARQGVRALLYDIHGNLPALDAVIADARGRGAGEFVLGGDYALAGAWPEETVKRLDKLDGVWIRGNADRWLEDPSDAPDDELLHRLIAYCRHELGGKRVERLFDLPPSISLDGALVCHASPHDDTLTFMPEPTGGDHELLAHTEEDVVFFGHSHLQFMRDAEGGRLLVNPGSVGLPFDGDRRAAYALWSGGRDVELRRVEYDSDAYAASMRERMSVTLGPHVETLVRRVREAAMVQ